MHSTSIALYRIETRRCSELYGHGIVDMLWKPVVDVVLVLVGSFGSSSSVQSSCWSSAAHFIRRTSSWGGQMLKGELTSRDTRTLLGPRQNLYYPAWYTPCQGRQLLRLDYWGSFMRPWGNSYLVA
jgi:hypothetical protein